jgi:aspartate kinase
MLYDSGNHPVSVNSARNGVSDRLMKVWGRELPFKDYADQEEAFYSEVFMGRSDRDIFMRELNSDFRIMEGVLGAAADKETDSHRESFVLSHGETEAGVALQYLLRDFQPGMSFLDGFEAGVVATRMRGSVNIARSIENIGKKKGGKYCYGGFVGRDPNDGKHYCLLDRNSTDVTAALVAAALGADEYVNIKDVDGVYVCDPGLLENGEKPGVIPGLSYDEAMNITRSGSPVIHPAGIIISKGHGIRIRIKSLENGGEGTIISEASGTTREKPYAAMSSGVYTCLTVMDPAMDIPGSGRGYAADIMGILAEAGYDILIPTGPGNAMSVVVAGGNEVSKDRKVDVNKACAALKSGLGEKGRSGEVHGRELGYISVTGAAIRNMPGTFMEVLKVMADEGISISLPAGADEYFVATPVLSFCVNPEDYRRAVNALRKKLF